ncbi:hypothetical protein EVB55_206 [Rhizobium phage RHph_Y68]|uniref:Uncharacterized protein n=1 Tax=Rhizobium phage RHph_Y68 TaxID=2509787 RepID=A0A7S5QYA3_9CAUD|nr:hypothetical protein PP934_gp206 [Rhizobium phage RHph_Y68]QIG68141.1 hypothetical protein EVB55_206 [Rhizobium phage RHph_Y68]
MYTRIHISSGNHAVLTLETSLPSVKESFQDLIAHFVLTVGAYEDKVKISCEGPFCTLIDEQIDNNLHTWINNFKRKFNSYKM